MFGVLMSVQPLKPTSFQPRSSATMWTMLGFGPASAAVSEERQKRDDDEFCFHVRKASGMRPVAQV